MFCSNIEETKQIIIFLSYTDDLIILGDTSKIRNRMNIIIDHFILSRVTFFFSDMLWLWVRKWFSCGLELCLEFVDKIQLLASEHILPLHFIWWIVTKRMKWYPFCSIHKINNKIYDINFYRKTWWNKW